MYIEVRFYQSHDLDLVMLHKNGSVSFERTIRLILNSYAQNQIFYVKPNEPTRELKTRASYRIRVSLDEQQDKGAIELLEKLKHGYRNHFIKMLLRKYLLIPVPENYVIGDQNYFDERMYGFVESMEVIIANPAKRYQRKETLPPGVKGIFPKKAPKNLSKESISVTLNGPKKEYTKEEADSSESEITDMFLGITGIY